MLGIERTEMKSRIGKLEENGRTNKRLQRSLSKHVRILKNTLKKEREKNKASETEIKFEEKKDSQETLRSGPVLKRAFAFCSKRSWLMWY